MSKADVILDGPEEHFIVEWDARDARRAELGAAKALGLPVLTKFQALWEAYPTNALSLVVFHAAIRAGQFTGTWNDWQARYVDATILGEEEDGGADPTPPVLGIGSL